MKASCEYDNVDDRITDATGYKERGTVYFKASKYSMALTLYKRGLGIVEKSSFTKEEEKEATKGVRIPLLLNMAACFLKLEKSDEARQQCEKVCVCVSLSTCAVSPLLYLQFLSFVYIPNMLIMFINLGT